MSFCWIATLPKIMTKKEINFAAIFASSDGAHKSQSIKLMVWFNTYSKITFWKLHFYKFMSSRERHHISVHNGYVATTNCTHALSLINFNTKQTLLTLPDEWNKVSVVRIRTKVYSTWLILGDLSTHMCYSVVFLIIFLFLRWIFFADM